MTAFKLSLSIYLYFSVIYAFILLFISVSRVHMHGCPHKAGFLLGPLYQWDGQLCVIDIFQVTTFSSRIIIMYNKVGVKQ